MPVKKQWKIPIQLSRKYSERELKAIGMDVIDTIVERTQKGKNKNGENFPVYSDAYTKSIDFKNAGKSDTVDLTLSGDMLASLKILSIKKGKIEIGFEDGSIENAKAEGNILGTYGTDKPNPKKARDFLGITDKEKEKILSSYPTNDARVRDKSVGQQEFAKELVDFVFGS